MTDREQTDARIDASAAVVDRWAREAYPERLRPPTGVIGHPFVDYGAAYTDVLWDWDAYFSCVGLQRFAGDDEKIATHARGCVDEFMRRQGADGHVPYVTMALHSDAPDADAVRGPDTAKNSSKPLLAQFACLVHAMGGGDADWLATHRDGLARHVEHWYATQFNEKFDLLTWRSHRGSGADNHPAYFQRPHDSVADPFLNSMMVMECQALAKICRLTGADPSPWQQRGEALAAAIERWLWDPIDGTYHAIDVGAGDPGAVNTDADWAVPLKFRHCVMVWPLLAGIASADRAERVVREHLVPADQLRSPYGLRSLARCEPAYRIFANHNPSDWCGPVWVIATYLGFRALLNYGYHDEAASLATDHLACLAADFEKNGVLHEYYHPEQGQGMTHPGFVNWNLCATLMPGELESDADHVRDHFLK